MKFDIPKSWAVYLAFVWGLWTAIICSVIDGELIWNIGYTFFFALHIIVNIFVFFVVWHCEKRSSEEIKKGNVEK